MVQPRVTPLTLPICQRPQLSCRSLTLTSAYMIIKLLVKKTAVDVQWTRQLMMLRCDVKTRHVHASVILSVILYVYTKMWILFSQYDASQCNAQMTVK